MDGNECKTKENIHNNKRKLKITWEKKLPTTYIAWQLWHARYFGPSKGSMVVWRIKAISSFLFVKRCRNGFRYKHVVWFRATTSTNFAYSLTLGRTCKLSPPPWYKREGGGVTLRYFEKFLPWIDSMLCHLQDDFNIMGYLCKWRCWGPVTSSNTADALIHRCVASQLLLA